MADYGVPEDADGLLPWSWAAERLAASRNFWVATASKTGRPHAMPVWGLWMEERHRFFFSSAPSARKVANLRANPGVVVTVDDTVEVVVVEGQAHEIRTAEHRDIVARWAAKYGVDGADDQASADQLEEFLADTVGFLVEPERAFAIIERPEEFGPRATRWVWDPADRLPVQP
jgi:hypothetical protein